MSYLTSETYASREYLKAVYDWLGVNSLLDCGSDDCEWESPGFSGHYSARKFFGIPTIIEYSPSYDHSPADVVQAMDTLPYLKEEDVDSYLISLFRLCKKALVLKVNTYECPGYLTIRDRDWWARQVEAVAYGFPGIHVVLIAANEPDKSYALSVYKAEDKILEPAWSDNKWVHLFS